MEGFGEKTISKISGRFCRLIRHRDRRAFLSDSCSARQLYSQLRRIELRRLARSAGRPGKCEAKTSWMLLTCPRRRCRKRNQPSRSTPRERPPLKPARKPARRRRLRWRKSPPKAKPSVKAESPARGATAAKEQPAPSKNKAKEQETAELPKKPPTLPPPLAPSWTLKAGETVGRGLQTWGDRAGWKVVWNLTMDPSVPAHRPSRRFPQRGRPRGAANPGLKWRIDSWASRRQQHARGHRSR